MEEKFKDIEKLVKEAGVHTPSSNFLHNVMNQVEASSKSSTVYKPLISKSGWVFIGLFTVGLFISLIFSPSSKMSILDTIDLSFLNVIKVKNPFSGFILPKTTMYGILFLGILFFVQVTVLSKRIHRSFSL